MIRSLLTHFYVAGETPDMLAILAADWLVALRGVSLAVVAEARRRWLATEARRPTIAAFLRLVEDARAGVGYDPEGGRVLLPRVLDQATGDPVPYGQLADPDRWSWHARNRAFRRRHGFDGPDPTDRDGRYADADLDRQAEAELPTPPRGSEAAYRPGPRPPAHVVRDDWRVIRRRDLTDAELDIASAEIQRKAAVAKEAAATLRRMPGVAIDPRTGRGAADSPLPPPAREIVEGVEKETKAFRLKDEDDPAVRDWLGRLDTEAAE